MKIFISWSGETSKGIGEVLNTWLRCIIQSIEIFFSPTDIDKGEGWQERLSTELSNCNFGIIILTYDNINKPWINFEAGAIAKALDSRVATLLVNVNPSTINGPLAKFQGTLLKEGDFLNLIKSINQALEKPLDEAQLAKTFEAIWPKIDEDIQKIDITSSPQKKETVPKYQEKNTQHHA